MKTHCRDIVKSTIYFWLTSIVYTLLEYKAGPASTVGEHSLRKIFVRGDRGSNLAEDASFQTAKRTYMFDGTSIIGQATISQPRSEKAVAIRSTV